jgi:hypothetical protein
MFNSLFLHQTGVSSNAAGGDAKFNDHESGTFAASEKKILVMISSLKQIAVSASFKFLHCHHELPVDMNCQ